MIYLASASPRRRELLRQIGVEFQLLPVVVDESACTDESQEDHVRRLAVAKAEAGYRSIIPGQIVRPILAADTIVVVDGSILGKPADRRHGIEMLQALSGRAHQVLTSVALKDAGQIRTALSVSTVSFRKMTVDECQAYWETGEAADKAGAYAIQGRAAMFISHLSGSYSGVMGLPLYETAQLLMTAGVEWQPLAAAK